MNDTPYSEVNALFAVQSGDRNAAMEILEKMLPGELMALGNAAYELGDMCRAHEREARRR